MIQTVVPASSKGFDETGYLLANPDVAEAVKRGRLRSGKAHYDGVGHGESRGIVQVADIERSRIQKLDRLHPFIKWDEPVRRLLHGGLDCLPPALAELAGVEATAAVSQHDYDPTIRQVVESNADKLILDAGAGFRPVYYPHVVNLEIVPYVTTDVLGILEKMPFANDTFDFVISNAVLEHVRDPFSAAREITRVLKPGGRMFLLVPFLQPYHGYPHHYYNMTKNGLRNLVADAEVVSHTVPVYFHPVWSASWFMNAWARGLSSKTRAEFERMTVKEFMDFHVSHMNAPFVRELSEEKQFELASGTFLIAQKRIS